jgi:hypothetical protein
MAFSMENGEWKLSGFYVKLKKAEDENITDAKNGKSYPKTEKNNNASIQRYAKMVKNAIHTFAVSVNEKSMKRMYGYMGEKFRRQYSVEKFNKSFSSFISQSIDLTVLDPMNPIFDLPPRVNGRGELELKGHYETSPSILYFDLLYYRDNGEWKMSGMNIQIK